MKASCRVESSQNPTLPFCAAVGLGSRHKASRRGTNTERQLGKDVNGTIHPMAGSSGQSAGSAYALGILEGKPRSGSQRFFLFLPAGLADFFADFPEPFTALAALAGL